MQVVSNPYAPVKLKLIRLCFTPMEDKPRQDDLPVVVAGAARKTIKEPKSPLLPLNLEENSS